MQFVVIARDSDDAEAPARRAKARTAHLENVKRHIKHLLVGAATLDNDGKMNGSAIIADFPSREALDTWLASDAYVTERVWGDITITPCQVAPSFQHLLTPEQNGNIVTN